MIENMTVENEYRNKLSHVRPHKVCTRKTDLVIEGFPRSGNSFFCRYILLNNDITLAHHTHNINNILLGVELKKPCVILARCPKDAILSFMIYSGKSVEAAAKRYELFYNQVIPLKKHVVIAEFDNLVSSPDSVVELINNKFEMSLRYSPNEREDILRAKNVKNIKHKEVTRKVGTPNDERERLKFDLSEDVNNYLSSNKSVNDTFERIFD